MVIARVEATPLGTDAHFLVTNQIGCAKQLYEHVCYSRGRMISLITTNKLYAQVGKTARRQDGKTACRRW